MKKYKAMRDLIVANIKQLIVLLRERNITIDTRCVVDGNKKSLTSLTDIKQEVASFNVNNMETEYKYSNIVCFQEDVVRDLDYIFTTEEISISVVTSLIHVSIYFVCLC